MTAELRLKEPEEVALRSVVTQLSSDEPSAMCVWGFEPHVYCGSGAAVAFHGAAVHGSMRWAKPNPRRSVWKLTHFFVLPDDQDPSCA